MNHLLIFMGLILFSMPTFTHAEEEMGVDMRFAASFYCLEKASLSPLYNEKIREHFEDLRRSAKKNESDKISAERTIHTIQKYWFALQDGSNIHSNLSKYVILPYFPKRVQTYYEDLVRAIRAHVASFTVNRPKKISLAWVIQLHQIYRAVNPEPGPILAWRKGTEKEIKLWQEKRKRTHVSLVNKPGESTLNCEENTCYMVIRFQPINHDHALNKLLKHQVSHRREYTFSRLPDSPWDRVIQRYLLLQMRSDKFTFRKESPIFDIHEEKEFMIFSEAETGAPLKGISMSSKIVKSKDINKLFEKVRRRIY